VNKWRRKRFLIFKVLVKNLPKPLKILDAGGTENFWIQMGFTNAENANIVILNPEPVKTTYNNIIYTEGDARDLSRFKDNEFDIVFSNSAIEHVGDFEDQKKMAREVRRTGKKHFVQTPNYFFPLEPHFLFPFFQFFPQKLQIFLLMSFPLGWFNKCKTRGEALDILSSIRLLKKNELALLFPESSIIKEKFLFFTKSFMVLSK
jgi:hypothetical protein